MCVFVCVRVHVCVCVCVCVCEREREREREREAEKLGEGCIEVCRRRLAGAVASFSTFST